MSAAIAIPALKCRGARQCAFCKNGAPRTCCTNCGMLVCVKHGSSWRDDNGTPFVYCCECEPLFIDSCNHAAAPVRCTTCPHKLCGDCCLRCEEEHKCAKLPYCVACGGDALSQCERCFSYYCRAYVGECCPNGGSESLCRTCARKELLACDNVQCAARACEQCIPVTCRVCEQRLCRECVKTTGQQRCSLLWCASLLCNKCMASCSRCKGVYCADHGVFVCGSACQQDLCANCISIPCVSCTQTISAAQPVGSQ